MLIEPEIAGASIVLIGNFNPAIFSPDWFIRQGAIKQQEIVADDPNFIVHSQVAQIKLDWCSILIEPNRYTISTIRDPLVQISDLTARIFGEFLPHTPLRQLGINRNVHFRVESLEVRDAIGYQLAPPESWGDWAPNIRARSGLKRGGMVSLTMQQQVFAYERSGYISTTVQPSTRIVDGFGVFVEVNDHFDPSLKDNESSTRIIMSILEDGFESSLANADTIIDQIMKLAYVRPR
ncbi:MAG: hypothetical protein ACREC6_12220 [Hyphomicrobiaceae bacterium]